MTRNTRNGHGFSRRSHEHTMRKSHVNIFGDVVSLFRETEISWSVAVLKESSKVFMSVTVFHDSKLANAHYNKLKRRYKLRQS